MVTAGILVIGNEVLSGKVEEENARFLVQKLRSLGIDLMRVCVVRDDVSVIAEEVQRMAERYTWVFTSGGVGSTHDDVTLAAVAQAFDVGLIENPDIRAILEGYFGDRMNAAVRRMAQLPEGTELLGLHEMSYPVIRVRNVYVFPGVPRYLRAKFEYLEDRLRTGRPFVLRQIFLCVSEDLIAIPLAEEDLRFPNVEFGSYPQVGNEAYMTKLTLEGRDSEEVDRALSSLLSRLESEWVVRKV